MKIRKVDDKPMVIHTKEKAKIHAHEPKGAKIKGSNIYTVERGPKTAGAKVTDTDRKKSYRKSTIHQSEPKNKGLSRFKQNLKESNTSIKTKNTNLHIAGRTGALVAGAVTDQVEGGQEVSQAAYLAYEARQCELNAQLDLENAKAVDADLSGPEEEREADDRMESAAIVAEDKGAYTADREGRTR